MHHKFISISCDPFMGSISDSTGANKIPPMQYSWPLYQYNADMILDASYPRAIRVRYNELYLSHENVVVRLKYFR